MSFPIVSSDAYKKYLSLPPLQPVPDYVKNLLSDHQLTHVLGVGGLK